jgi:nucleotide-binding universal stress UspA family protein
MYKHILVATDGTKLSNVATNKAIELAHHMGAKLTIVNIIPKMHHNLFEGDIETPAKQKTEIMNRLTESANKLVLGVQKHATKMGVDSKTLVVKSTVVSEGIVKTAISKKADLIVMASHGRNGISRLLLGSETQQVLTHSKIDVLVLR